MTENSSEPLFQDISSDSVSGITEIESLCVHCEKNGTTRLLLTRIPFFRDVIISSFNCDFCGFNNRSLDPAHEIQDEGIRFTLEVKSPNDLNRRLVINSGAIVSLPNLDATFPMSEGFLTTVEGTITKLVDNIEQLQPARKEAQPEVYQQLNEFITKLKTLLKLHEPFTLVLEDASGNSHVENTHAPAEDPQLLMVQFKRSREQDVKLGMYTEDNVPEAEEVEEPFDPKAEVMTFEVNCPNCGLTCDSNMKMMDIPFFKEVIIMATVCTSCGFRDNEVKGGCGVTPLGRRITLHLTSSDDLCRDVLKSETSALRIPELDLDTEAGTLGGKFTTVEGLLSAMREQLSKFNPFVFGDSANEDDKENNLAKFLAELDKIISGERLDVHVILDDPAGNSYIQNVYAPDDDPELKIEEYERNFEQNESLGLNDMNTEGFTS